MKIIKLNHNKESIVDDEDFEWISEHKWISCRGWVMRTTKNESNKSVYLHREILCAPEDVHCDHINGNPLDNRRCNLRLATRSQNMMNKKVQKNCKSGYKGVAKRFGYGKLKWRSQIYLNGGNKHIGYFKTPEEAALAYNERAKKEFGEFAWLNKVEGKQ